MTDKDKGKLGVTSVEPKGGDTSLALKVVVVAGPEEGLEMPLEGEVVVGSDRSCQLRLNDRAVSRKHATLVAEGGRVVVHDLGSRNGTFIADVKIKEGQVPYGGIVTIGESAVTVLPRWHVRELAPSPRRRFGDVLGESVPMRAVFAVLECVAPTNMSVLLEGESGTGKDLIAGSIHAASPRKASAHVLVDCSSAASPELADSELFGHKRGAFSGAVADHPGAFVRASGGTISLDEIGDLPLAVQAKLLRFLETGEVKPLGASAARKLDVRVIASTKRDLRAEARLGRFRQDLLHRLEIVRIRIPPLRHRPEDIPILVAHLLEGHVPEGDAISGDNLRKLVAYAWPGNVRELKSTVKRALALAGKAPRFESMSFQLGPASAAPATIGLEYPGVAAPMAYKEAREQVLVSFHRAYVAAVLERHDGDVPTAAAEAGLSRKQLEVLIKRVEDEGAACEVADGGLQKLPDTLRMDQRPKQ